MDKDHKVRDLQKIGGNATFTSPPPPVPSPKNDAARDYCSALPGTTDRPTYPLFALNGGVKAQPSCQLDNINSFYQA
jgi:hypothetical protein